VWFAWSQLERPTTLRVPLCQRVAQRMYRITTKITVQPKSIPFFCRSGQMSMAGPSHGESAFCPARGERVTMVPRNVQLRMYFSTYFL